MFALPVSKVTVADDGKGMARFLGAPTQGRTGSPALPRMALRVLLPPDADLSTVRVSLVGIRTEVIPGDWDVEPAPIVATLSGKTILPEGVVLVNGRDPQAYQLDAYSPTSCIAQLTKRRIRQWRIAGVVFAPYQHNPAKKRLRRVAEGKLAVHFKRLTDYREPLSRSPEIAEYFRRQVRKQVVNFDEMARLYKNGVR